MRRLFFSLLRDNKRNQAITYYEKEHYTSTEISRRLRRKEELSDPWYRLVLRFLEDALVEYRTINKDVRVVEVGCGLGGLCKYLGREVDNIKIVAGVDISMAALKVAKNFSSEKTSFVCGDIAALPFNDSSFEIVICSETLEHCFVMKKAVRELARICTPGGYVIVTTPNCYIRGLPDLIRKLFIKMQPEQLTFWHTIRYLLQCSGLDIIMESGEDFAFDMFSPEYIPERIVDQKLFRWVAAWSKKRPLAWRFLCGTIGFLCRKPDSNSMFVSNTLVGSGNLVASLLALTSFGSYNTGYTARLRSPKPFASLRASYSPKPLGAMPSPRERREVNHDV